MGSVKSECYGAHLFVNVFFISVEIVDKVVDAVILKKYKEGKLSNNPQENVYYALDAFFFIGLFISLARSALSLRAIKQHCCTSNYDKGKTNEAIHFWMSLAKLWLEAFPQAMFGRFFFGDCATTDAMKSWGQAFGFFSLLPFIVFVFHLVYHCCPYCKYQYDEEPKPLTLLVVFTTLMGSLLGSVCAVLSIIAFTERCS